MRVTPHPYAIDGWGVGELWVGDGRLVVAHDPPAARRAGTPTGTLPTKPSRERDGFVEDLLRRFHGYFAGEPVSFTDVELDLDGLTAFQRDTAQALRGVPWGEVVTYGELAELAGYARAARAAGSFCAENRHSLLIPCHRVIAVGGLGGFGSLGVAYKRRLLGLEGHATL